MHLSFSFQSLPFLHGVFFYEPIFYHLGTLNEYSCKLPSGIDLKFWTKALLINNERGIYVFAFVIDRFDMVVCLALYGSIHGMCWYGGLRGEITFQKVGPVPSNSLNSGSFSYYITTIGFVQVVGSCVLDWVDLSFKDSSVRPD